jgi:mRNA export factor
MAFSGFGAPATAAFGTPAPGGFGAPAASGFGAAAASGHNPNNDYEVSPGVLTDTVSSLAFSPTANMLAAGTWDKNVMLWNINYSGGVNIQAEPTGKISHAAPVLDVCWKKDGSQIFSASCDNSVKMWAPNRNQGVVVAQHEAPVTKVKYVEELNQTVLTGSLDRTCKYWDLRTPGKAVMQYALPERVYAMDANFNLAVVAMGGPQRMVHIYDLRNPANPFRTLQSPLKFQSSCVACFTDKTGFALGSIEGRVAIHYSDPSRANANFAFKCHRQKTVEVYPVTSIAFHPRYGTFATAGADGCFNFWDKDSKQRLKYFKQCNQPITATAWNGPGDLFAYAVGYDWHKGREHHNPAMKSHILIHATPPDEIKPRQKK